MKCSVRILVKFFQEMTYTEKYGIQKFLAIIALDVHIRSIRKILPNSNILTKRGIGYKVKDLNKNN